MTTPSIPLYLNHAHPCDYLPGNSSRTVFVDPAYPMNPEIYSRLVARGFRRSGELVYRPQCESCSACIPIRIPVATFEPDRRQRRTLKINCDVHAIHSAPVFSQEHYNLYLRYQRARHGDGGMAQAGPEEYMRFLSSRWCRTRFVEFRLDKRLAAVSVIDELENALSAVYTFFDPALSNRSLGTYSVLWQIAEAAKLQRQWVYLGYWIADCRKMSYKVQFRPHEIFIGEQWCLGGKREGAITG